MTIEEINKLWLDIQERRDEIEERYAEGEIMIVLDELNGIYNSRILELNRKLLEAGFHPVLAKAICMTKEGDY